MVVGLGGAVSPSTVRRTLHSMGFEYKNPKWQTRLTQRQVQRRLKFARKHRDGGPWSKTLFTDSSYFVVTRGKRRWVLREEQNTATRDKKPAKVHVYAGICARGKTNLHFVTGTDGQSPPAELNYKGKGVGGGEYRLLLEKHLVPEAQAVCSKTFPTSGGICKMVLVHTLPS